MGAPICFAFADEGASIALFDRYAAMAARIPADTRRKGSQVTPFTVDLTQVKAAASEVTAVEADLGPFAVLVNNVGWNGRSEFVLDLPPERWEQAYRLNLFPTLKATRAVLPRMVERCDGSIVSISSDAGFGKFRMGDYGPMKAV